MRLVDADPLPEAMKERKGYIGRASDPICLVEDAPTIDAVPVVRCKDCKYKGSLYSIYCAKEHNSEGRDWFCADGERRSPDA